MFYCPKCLNIYNITKSIKSKEQQSGGGKLDDIIQKILDNENLEGIEFDQDDLDNLNGSQLYKKLTNKQKDYVYNLINDMVEKKIKNSDDKKGSYQRNMYFICKNCGNHEVIKDGTIIVSKENTKDIKIESNFNPKEMLQIKILPRTRDYICPNDSCKSHKNHSERSAVFMRINNTYKMRYICEACETVWNVS